MKTYRILSLVLFVGLFGLAGCSDDDSDKFDFQFPEGSGKLKAVLYEGLPGKMVSSEAYAYDAEGRLARIQQFDSGDYENGKGLISEKLYTYNAVGQVEKEVYYLLRDGEKRISLYCTTMYEYTPEGEVAHETVVYPNNDSSYNIHYTYTYVDGRLSEKITRQHDYDPYTIRYTYKGNEQMEAITYFFADEPQSRNVYFYEDGLNTRIDYYARADRDNISLTTHMEYDKERNLTKVSYSNINITVDGIGSRYDFCTRHYIYF